MARPGIGCSSNGQAVGEDEGDDDLAVEGDGEGDFDGLADGDFDGLGEGDFDGVGRTVGDTDGRTGGGMYVGDGLTERDGFAAADAERVGLGVGAVVAAELLVLVGSGRTADRGARSGEG